MPIRSLGSKITEALRIAGVDMVVHSHRSVTFLVSAAIFACTWSPAFGQLVGAKDFTQGGTEPPTRALSKADLAEKNENFCLPNGGNADGVDLSSGRPALALSVTKAELDSNRSELGLTVTVRLKNLGDGSISVPWTDHRVASALMPSSGDSQEYGFTVATVDLYLGRAHTTDPMMSLKGEAALWTQPGNTEQSIKLDPGQWLEITFRTTILCQSADPNECLNRLRKEKLKVSAWWYQRRLTSEMKGDCIYQTGAYTQLEIDSEPTDVKADIPASLILEKP
jgi:hypothetical protein